MFNTVGPSNIPNKIIPTKPGIWILSRSNPIRILLAESFLMKDKP